MAKNDEIEKNENETSDPENAGLTADGDQTVVLDKKVYDAMLLGLAAAAGKNASTANENKRIRKRIIDRYDGDAWRDSVEMPIHIDSNKHKDDLFVSVNGRRMNIKRGETVNLPRAVAEVIKNSEQQDQRAARLIAKLTRSSRII